MILSAVLSCATVAGLAALADPPAPHSPAPPALLGGRKLVQVAFTTTDLERARRYYRDTLGLPFLFEAGRMIFFDVGGVRLMIGVEPSLKPGGSVLYLDAPDIDTLCERLEKRGIVFSSPIEVVQRTAAFELKLREFKDPDGNSLALMGAVPHRR